jgi:hypothetical protein
MREEGLNLLVADAEDMQLGTRFDTIVAGELIPSTSPTRGVFWRAAAATSNLRVESSYQPLIRSL